MQTDNMAKKMLIDATHAEETRVVVVDGNKVEEFDFESENKRQLAGNIYLAKVTRVEPSLQAAFVDYGGNRHGFLAFSEIHPDYYQIPVADRERLLEEERAYDEESQRQRDADDEKPQSREKAGRGSRRRSRAERAASDDAVAQSGEISGMETIDPDEAPARGAGGADADADEGLSPMERVADTPVEEPAEAPTDATGDDAAKDGPGLETGADAPDAAESRDKDAAAADARDEAGTPARAEIEDAPAVEEAIESVADDDDVEDMRPPRKPRPRRYKIQEVIKVRQIMLVQVVKEERGNKGAALTTYLSLAGRYCVLMPNTARGGGISRKITNAVDRKKLKQIAAEIDVPRDAGLIIRTAGAKRTKAEIKRDYEYLQRLWEQIRDLTLKSIAPAKIYEEGDLIKRSIRDLYNREIDEVLVEGEDGYRIAKDFMKMIMPSHAKNVKQHSDQLPLFARFQVESYLSSMFNPTVQLKSGGYIVIGVTEALVAIDVNSGKATRQGSIEETALQTNLEAAEEIARQLRLRDLAGLIVIDFIDMDERRNNAAVEKCLKDKLKNDRARIQMGRISGFGLMEMSRQRLRPGMIEATTQPCPHCHGTGLIRSDDNLALSILRQIEEEGTRRRSREVLVKCPIGIANYLMNQKREHVAQIEARYGLSVRIEGDAALISPDFGLEKFKNATRSVPEALPFVSAASALIGEAETPEMEGDAPEEIAEEAPRPAEAKTAGDGAEKPKKRRRRRRRKSKSPDGAEQQTQTASGDDVIASEAVESAEAADAAPDAAATTATTGDVATDAPGADATPRRTRKPRARKSDRAPDTAASGAVTETETPSSPSTEGEAVSMPVDEPVAEAVPLAGADTTAEGATEDDTTGPAPKPARKPRTRSPSSGQADADTGSEGASTNADSPATAEPLAPTLPGVPAEAARAVDTVAPAKSGTAAQTAAPVGADAAPPEQPDRSRSEPATPEAPAPEEVETPDSVTADDGTPDEKAEAEGDDTGGKSTVADAETDATSPKPRRRGWWSFKA